MNTQRLKPISPAHYRSAEALRHPKALFLVLGS